MAGVVRVLSQIPTLTPITHGTSTTVLPRDMVIVATGQYLSLSSSLNLVLTYIYASALYYNTNSENLLALTAPTTTKCDMCQVSFCGIGIQNRCVALPLMAQHPHGLSDVGDLIQSSEVYDAFDGNAVEVEIMLDYFTAKRISPRDVYREVCASCFPPPPPPHPLLWNRCSYI